MSLTNPVRPAPGTPLQSRTPQPDDDSSLDDVPKLEEVELLQMEADAEQTLAAKIMAECFLR